MSGRKPHHRPGDAKIARIICLRAEAEPGSICWRCGLTKAELIALGHTEADAKWTSGHTDDGNRASTMLAEHAWCNSRAGAYYGNSKRQPTSEDW